MTIDLNQLVREHGYEAEITPPEPPQDGALRRFKERWLFVTALVLVVSMTTVILTWLVAGSPTADDKKWLFGLLGSILGFSASVLSKK
jgi:hypothetical protein